MQVSKIDHVNIVTDDLDETMQFYQQVIGLAPKENLAMSSDFRGAWMCDPAGNALVHLVEKTPGQPYGEGHETGVPTGAIHHVALQCSGIDAMLARLEELEIAHRVNRIDHIGLTQIFVSDPNAVTLELNFPGD